MPPPADASRATPPCLRAGRWLGGIGWLSVGGAVLAVAFDFRGVTLLDPSTVKDRCSGGEPLGDLAAARRPKDPASSTLD